MKDKTPSELVEWVEERANLLNKLAQKVKKECKELEDVNTKTWLLRLLEDLTAIEKVSKRGVHLLTTYGIRAQVASPTEISKASDITITATSGRVGGKLSQEVWQEVWPQKRK